MTTDKQLGDGGISSPTVFGTEAEALAHQTKTAELEEALRAMSPAERAQWFRENEYEGDDE